MTTFTPDTDNKMFQLAVQLVNQSNRNIFLTGKAGTGKTTFLKYIGQNCPKQMAVVAPTGVAAINAGGVTIHSFFQIPFEPFLPESVSRHQLISRLRFNSEKIKVLQELELLVIDEISMVRCDVLDAIDIVLRHIRHRPSERFGGIQVLFIGDMLQLPPVIKPMEWQFLSEFYSGQYFFDSLVLQQEPPLYIEFSKIYRQNEEQFIYLLNQVRNNELDENGLMILESRFNPAFRRCKGDGYIVLTTHNNKAAEINAGALREIDAKSFTYDAEIVDDFPNRAYPADETLFLKAGAQVMFIKNDTAENGKRFFNGKIGVVSRLEEDKVFVRCEKDAYEIEVQKEKWENIRYTVDKVTRKLESDILGSFSQYPLRLAWAITIHKSQGLTFEKAIIDAGEAFAPGQVYVALSRCTNLQGMVLQSKIKHHSLFNDRRIIEFSQQAASGSQLEEELAIARKNYQQVLLNATFDFTVSINNAKDVLEYILGHSSSFDDETVPWLEKFIERLKSLQAIATKFQQQLQLLFLQAEYPECNQALQERIKAASNYFITEIKLLTELLQNSPAITDSRLYAKEYNESIREIFAILSEKKFLIEGFSDPFSIELFHQQKQKFIMPGFFVNAYAGADQKKAKSPHPVLHQQLRKLRESICSRKNLPIYIVAGSKTIDEMALYLPQSLHELNEISGFGVVKIEQYGQQFLDVILAYTQENNLESLIHEKTTQKEKKKSPTTKKPKIDTKAASFQLFTEGKTISEIAVARNLTQQTIEGHLAHYVEKGEIKIERLVTPEKLEKIEPVIRAFTGGAITELKQKIGIEVSFGEIKLALAWLAYRKKHSGN